MEKETNKEWLLRYLRERDLGEQDNYSVGVCSSCGNRSLWGGGMTGQRITTCRKCGIQQRHSFEDFSLANVKHIRPDLTSQDNE